VIASPPPPELAATHKECQDWARPPSGSLALLDNQQYMVAVATYDEVFSA
jgi:hypothetical protein